MTKRATPEIDLTAPVVQRFRTTGWTVHEEPVIQLPGRSKPVPADLVAVRDDVIALGQGKMHLNPKLIAQVAQFAHFCHDMYLWVPGPDPATGYTPERRVLIETAKHHGICVLHVFADGTIKRAFDRHGRETRPRRNHNPNLTPVIEAISNPANVAPPGLNQRAGTASPLGRRSYVNWHAWADVREYVNQNQGEYLNTVARALGMSKQRKGELSRALERKEPIGIIGRGRPMELWPAEETEGAPTVEQIRAIAKRRPTP